MNLSAYSQIHLKEPLKTRSVIISSGDTIIRMEVITGSIDIKVKSDLTYYWYDNNCIQSNVGGFAGKLLHGNFQVFSSGALVEEGKYYKGVKQGQWITWLASGIISEINEFDDGLLFGEVLKYNSKGALIESCQYRNGLRHGEYWVCKGDSTISENYNRGVLVRSKNK
jgi:antitoxin component YwqK of YwqJK toxin-antitoxin module